MHPPLRLLCGLWLVVGLSAGHQFVLAADDVTCKDLAIDAKASSAPPPPESDAASAAASATVADAKSAPTSKRCVVRTVKIGEDTFTLPDRGCTPGAINATLTRDTLTNPSFRTACVRDKATSAQQKETTYTTYGTPKPERNTGVMQTCELDHLVSLELGGADTLNNIWPQCGPDDVVLVSRFFKQKDIVENYLAKQVKDGVMELPEVQRGIAEDWTQYLEAAKKACPGGKCR
jgi:hypothetical protein